MSVAYDHYPDLHRLVDRLEPDQADKLRRYALRLVGDTAEQPSHRLSFTGIAASDNPDLAADAKKIIYTELRRHTE